MPVINSNSYLKLKEDYNSYWEPKGFEINFFKVGSYNSIVSKSFLLPHGKDTLAMVVISKPCMFELTFIPFVVNAWNEAKTRSVDLNVENAELEEDILSSFEKLDIDIHKLNKETLSIIQCYFHKEMKDPIDECMQFHFKDFVHKMDLQNVEILHDFEMTPLRRPKILVQTAGHVAGSVCMYRQEDLDQFEPEHSNKTNSIQDSETKIARSPRKLFPVCLHPKYGGWFSLRGVVVFKEIDYPELQVEPCR